MINIVLMAGKGQRFAEVGYKQSKPLLLVSGKPMIIRSVESMPAADTWVFIVRQDHLQEKELMDTLRSVGRQVTIVADPNPTGQLNSCLVARPYFESEENIFIGACDFGMVYDRQKYAALMDASNPQQSDLVSWSFTRQSNLSRNPQAWGWLRLAGNHDYGDDSDGVKKITGVSVKVPISDDPFNDYAITGSFSFRDGRTFLKIADELIRRDIKVKGEYYIDSMIGVAIDMGLRAVSFPVDKYIGWGTPADYEDYLFWEKEINRPSVQLPAGRRAEYLFWKEYFSKYI